MKMVMVEYKIPIEYKTYILIGIMLGSFINLFIFPPIAYMGFGLAIGIGLFETERYSQNKITKQKTEKA